MIDLVPAVNEAVLVRLSIDLGAASTGGPLAASERRLVAAAERLTPTPTDVLSALRVAIRRGDDPLGDLFTDFRSPLERRSVGAFYTPPEIVRPMVSWALAQEPTRFVDPGSGSGRFAAEALRQRPSLAVVAVDLDPVATLMTRAALAVLGAQDATVICGTYLTTKLPMHVGRTAWVGNPPYVRHHELEPAAKAWAGRAAKRLGHTISSLAGLHALFFLATALRARTGDIGCFVTSAEWLDTGYGAVVRSLLLDGLGGMALDLVDPRAVPFTDVMTTALITSFEAGGHPSQMAVRLVASPEDLGHLGAGTPVSTTTLAATGRWSPLFRTARAVGTGRRLGDLFAVHRGFVSGANSFFILTRARAAELGLLAWCRPAVTSAVEILRSDGVVRDGRERRLVLDIPAGTDRAAHPALDAYLVEGERAGIDRGYVCSHRKPWWRIGPGAGAPIVASYMARQAPRFALNPEGLALLNIGHGLHPREPMAPAELRALVDALNAGRAALAGHGRTYHGGLEKFEPREMEALLIPAVP